MTPERWHHIQRILDAAEEAPQERRQAVMAEACAGDEELQTEVEALLALEEDADEFIEEPLWSLNRSSGTESGNQAASAVLKQVGHYRLEKPLGKGGMGEVFLAVRKDDYEQQVALKLVSEGANRSDLLSRFYTERQILASLQHPNIARLLDGGALKDGRPYFVMEYVEGEPIDDYCISRGLSVRKRLELFRQVCKTVQFAHKNLVVHRDLKANNILVNAEGEPRLLDFGIAKLLQTGSVSNAAATEPGFVPMTPANASPEQLLDEPITTACDIYALGVLLYSLLGNRPPYRLDGCSFAEMVQVICLDEPPKPSAALLQEEDPLDERANGEFVDLSPGERRRLHRRLVGDLDAIVMKAMRKEPDQRYGSAAALEEDIRRYLRGLPVVAQRGNWVYHAKKFVRRNKLAILALLLIVGFAITATGQWFKAAEEREQAVLERQRAKKVTNFVTDLFKSVNPDQTGGAEISMREVLEGGKDLVGDLENDPQLRAELWGTLGSVYNNLGLYPDALELKKKALDSWLEFSSEDSPDLSFHINNLAKIQLDVGNYQEAEEYFQQALDMSRRLAQDPAILARAISNLASSKVSQGKYQEAEELLFEALKIRRGLGDNNQAVAATLHHLGDMFIRRGDFSSAEPYLQEALELNIQSLGPHNTKVALIRKTQGLLFHGQKRFAEARESFEQALRVLRQVLGKDHFKVARSEINFAALLLDINEPTVACELIEHALLVLNRARSEGDWSVADAESVLGHCLLAQGQLQEAESYLLKSYSTIRDARGSNSYVTHQALLRIIQLYEAWEQDEQAEKYREIARSADFPLGKKE